MNLREYILPARNGSSTFCRRSLTHVLAEIPSSRVYTYNIPIHKRQHPMPSSLIHTMQRIGLPARIPCGISRYETRRLRPWWCRTPRRRPIARSRRLYVQVYVDTWIDTETIIKRIRFARTLCNRPARTRVTSARNRAFFNPRSLARYSSLRLSSTRIEFLIDHRGSRLYDFVILFLLSSRCICADAICFANLNDTL